MRRDTDDTRGAATTARYERPVIIRHSLAGVNKYGAAAPIAPMTRFDGVEIAALVERFGSPLFVFSEAMLRARVRELKQQLSRRFAAFDLAWSYKTNYLGAICRIFRQEGSWAEVVSGMELRKALHDGVPGDQIVFNGPHKSEADLRLAFSHRARVHVDHFDEIVTAERVAEALDARPEVGLRVNISELPVESWDRFGFNLESGQALEAARRIVRGQRLRLGALHCHVGTFVQNAEVYAQAATALGRFMQVLRSELSVDIVTLDLGGGFASRNTLHAQYLPGDEASPALGEYVERIASGFDDAFKGATPAPRLMLETGRALVDEAAILVATVVGNKRLRDRRRAVILDAGVNVLPTAWWYRHPVHPAQEVHGTPEPTVFFGPLCMNIDVMRDRLMFPPLRVGDRVVFKCVGAYNVTQWMQFITERPNVVLLSPRGEAALIRRAEDLQVLLNQEEMPPWLS